MDFLLRYMKLEFKRAYKSFPKMLLGAIVLVLVIGSLAYCSETLLYANEEHDRAKVALAVEDDSSLVSMATTLLESSESISIVANFIRSIDNSKYNPKRTYYNSSKSPSAE